MRVTTMEIQAIGQNEQITRHERDIGEIIGRLESLATKDFVREVVHEQTLLMSGKFDAIMDELRAMNAKQHRILGAADIIKTVLPLLISIATLIVLTISLLMAGG